MKKYFLFLCVILVAEANAQTIITDKTVPAVGDSLYFDVDSMPVGISIGNPGEDLLWDFSTLHSHRMVSEVYHPAETGSAYASFPDANAVIVNGVQERYFKLSKNKIEELGTATRGGGGILGAGTNVYTKAVTVFRAPFTYGFTLNYTTFVSISISSSFIPDSLFAGLPIKPDSIRFAINTQFDREVDAWGKLQLPAKIWDVVREKRISTPSIKIEAKILSAWIDVTSIAAPIFQGILGSIRPTTSYAFFTNETKGYLAVVNVDSSNQATRIQYKPDDKIVLAVSKPLEFNKDVVVNYGSQSLFIQPYSLLEKDNHLFIMDMNGKEIERESMVLFANQPMQYTLRKKYLPGLYTIQIKNSKQVYNTILYLY